MNIQDNDNVSNNGSNSGGIYSKFQERLRKIRLSRSKKKRKKEYFVKDKVKEVSGLSNINDSKKEAIHTKSSDVSLDEVLTNIRSSRRDRVYGRRSVGLDTKKIDDNGIEAKINGNNLTVVSGKINIESFNETADRARSIPNIYVVESNIKRRRRVGYVSKEQRSDFSNVTDVERTELLDMLGAEILDKIKESFEEKLDEIQVLESELYVLSQENANELQLKKVKELKKRIKGLIDKVNVIIEQYNLYRKNYYIDNVIGIDDNVIVDDLIDYRLLLDGYENEREFVKQIHALEEFKTLYSSLVEVRDAAERLVLESTQKIDEYDARDKKYASITEGMVEALDIDKMCSEEIARQNDYFDNLMGKINDIDKQQYVTLHLRGFGELMGRTLRYMIFLSMMPMAGSIPGISRHTMASRRMIANAYRNLHLEEVNRVHYEAVDYDSELNHHLSDVNYADCLVEDALKDIDKLRADFMMIYDSNIPGYDDTLKKIMDIEKQLLHNQNRLVIVRNNLKRSKKLNEAKLVRVRELNDNERAA